MFPKNSTILFQGDSITDCGRDRENPNSCGNGYANMLKAQIQHDNPDCRLNVYNRGISGNRVVDLYARWKEDCYNLAPNIISILIGVNDVWSEYKRGGGVEADKFRFIYNLLLTETKNRLNDVTFILMEPFYLPAGDIPGMIERWEHDMPIRQGIVKDLAKEHGAIFVPLQAAFDNSISQASPEHWLHDGVHPTEAGHWLIAKTWLNALHNA